jgi:6-phosphogluconolactonase
MFNVEIFTTDYPAKAAAHIAERVASRGSLVLTGGTTAEAVYPALARHAEALEGTTFLFSDERCVPPSDPASNFGMARSLLLDGISSKTVHRMRGEDPPELAAPDYHQEISAAVSSGLDVCLLGMGADGHVAANFPGSLTLDESEQLCLPVDRPDGMRGLTLTPPALLSSATVLLIVTGESKAQMVKRVVEDNDPPVTLPARLLANHPSATFLLDEGAASALS